MKKLLALILTAALSLSLVACGGGAGNTNTSGGSGEPSTPEQENSPIESKGLFLLEREDGVELDDLTAQQTYLIHVYDIHPDNAKNVEMSPFESHYSITTNGVNEYEPLYAPTGYNINTTQNSVRYFMLASGYAAPPEIDTILAGGETIRAMSVYAINSNDIKDDTTATFTIESCDVLDCELNFTRDDIISISRFDEVFQIEDNPTDYQIAAAYFQRIKTICNNQATGTMFNKLTSNGLTSYAGGLAMIEGWTSPDLGTFSVTGFVLAIENAGLPQFDREAVKRVYPDLPVDAFEDSLETWLTNGKIAIESLNAVGNAGNEGDLADVALRDMITYGNEILEYYTAKLKNQ